MRSTGNPFNPLLWAALGLVLTAPLAVDSFILTPSQRCSPEWNFPSPFSKAHPSTTLFLSASSTLSERLKLGDRFDRWKFLQELLDDFVEDDDTHQVLFAVLEGCPHSDPEDGSLPTSTPEQKEIAANLILTNQEARAIPAMTKVDTLCQVEQLIPDQQEDEDGFKSTWDTVLELHGREIVKVNEQAGTERWKALSIVSRVLIHYEFLTEGFER